MSKKNPDDFFYFFMEKIYFYFCKIYFFRFFLVLYILYNMRYSKNVFTAHWISKGGKGLPKDLWNEPLNLPKKSYLHMAVKPLLFNIFWWDFFLPQVLIEIRRFRMFLAMPDHLRRPYPLEQGWPSECRIILGISNVIRNSCGHPCSRGVRSASDDPTSPKTCGIDVSRWVLAVLKKSRQKILNNSGFTAIWR